MKHILLLALALFATSCACSSDKEDFGPIPTGKNKQVDKQQQNN